MKSPQERRHAVANAPLPDDLPVARHAAALRAAVESHAVTIVCGETGSGKSTLLPRIAAAARPGLEGRIAITQPRRVAARAIAARISEDLGTPLGELAGFRTRFESRLDAGAPIVAITDGLLLQDLRHDRFLRSFDTIIVDEVHERSVAIDFLLGVLLGILKQRDDLRVVLSSATIDSERLAHHFGSAGVATSVQQVEGRLHPVEMQWEPVEEDDVLEACAAQVARLMESGRGDCLCFLPGEAEISHVQALLEGSLGGAAEVLPLYARLTSAEQDRIFAPGPVPRAILATNIAETSVTVPRIQSVVDSGLVRMARYSTRSRVMRLPIEPASQASARQRAGRAGRLGPGICVRLFSAEDFAARPAFTEPEMRRTNLAGVLLRMASLRLGAPERFPFVDPPSTRAIAEADETLRELGAIERRGHLTRLGRRLAELPIDPRLGAVLLAAPEWKCEPEAAIVVSFLSTNDPRVRGAARGTAAAAPGGGAEPPAWRDARSDFATIVALWRAWVQARESLGSAALKRWCVQQGLSHLRMREWHSIHEQLRRERSRQGGASASLGAESDTGALHRALVAGLACAVGERQPEGDYRLPSGQRMTIHPSSVLARGSPKWIIAAEVVDTGRRQARLCAPIRSEWVAQGVHHGLRRSVREPHWVQETGQVAAWEDVHWGALTVIRRHRVPFGPIDAAAARHVMIQGALLEGRVPERLGFLDRNDAFLARLRSEEARRRRAGLVPTEGELLAFFDARVPAEIHDWPSLRRWYEREARGDPDLLCLESGPLADSAAETPAYPDWIGIAGQRLPVEYMHAPGSAEDGATIRLDLAALDSLPDDLAVRRLFRPLAGQLREVAEALLRGLPKAVRHRLGTSAAIVDGFLGHLERSGGDPLLEWEPWLRWIGGDAAAAQGATSAIAAIPAHLLPRVEVVDGSGTTLLATRVPAELAALWEARRAGPGSAVDRPAAGDSAAPSRSAIRHHLEFDPSWKEFILASGVLGPTPADDIIATCARESLHAAHPEADLSATCHAVLGEWLGIVRAATKLASEIEALHGAWPEVADGVAVVAEEVLPPGALGRAPRTQWRRILTILEALRHALTRPDRADRDDPAGRRRWKDAERALERLRLRVRLRPATAAVPPRMDERIAALGESLRWWPVALLASHLRPPPGSNPQRWQRELDELDRDLTVAG